MQETYTPTTEDFTAWMTDKNQAKTEEKDIDNLLLSLSISLEG